MKKYGLKKKINIIMSILIAVFTIASAVGIFFFLKKSKVPHSMVLDVIVCFMMIFPEILIGVLLIISNTVYFIFDKDYFEYHEYGKNKRVEPKDVRYYSFHDNTFKIYYATYYQDQAYDEDGEPIEDEFEEYEQINIIAINNFFEFEQWEKIIEWFDENVECVYDEQEYNDVVEINEKFSYMQDDTMSEAFHKSHRYVKWVNIIAVILAVWLFVDSNCNPLPILIGIAYPWICLYILFCSRGMIKIDADSKSIYPKLSIALIASAFGVFIRSLFSIRVCAFKPLLIYAAIITVLFMILLIFYQLKYFPKNKDTNTIIIYLFVFMYFYSIGTVMTSNMIFDKSDGVEQTVQIEKKDFDVKVYSGALGIKWYFNPEERKLFDKL